MKKSVRLSVVIPCLNEATTVATQLEALVGQDWSEPWEVIVSDNGSTDNSMIIVEQFKGRLPYLRVVDSSDRRGPGHARNVGVAAAYGDLIAFCDADDKVATGWVAAMGKALCHYDLVACQIEDSQLNAPYIKEAWHPSRNGPRVSYGFLPAAASWGIGVKRAVHEAIGGFDETMLRLEDIDYCWRAQLAGAKLYFAPEAIVHYRYRHRLMAIYQQELVSGEYQILLYKKYAPLGMPARSWKSEVNACVNLLKRLPYLRRPKNQVRWVGDLGIQMGRLWGRVKYRSFMF